MLSKMKHGHALGSRIAEVHNGSSLFTGDAGQGESEHSPLDHRERLAGSDHRAAAQHVLQHRHRHLHLGAFQPQARAPTRQGAADRRDGVVPAAAQKSGARRIASWALQISSASATRSSRSRRRTSRRFSTTASLATGRCAWSDPCACACRSGASSAWRCARQRRRQGKRPSLTSLTSWPPSLARGRTGILMPSSPCWSRARRRRASA